MARVIKQGGKCIDCKAKISRQSKTGRCRACASRFNWNKKKEVKK